MLECVVNISEGRRSDVLATLDSSVAAAHHLDRHTCEHHNRSVFTLIGEDAPRQLAHAAVDTLGHLRAVRVTPANEQERAQVAALAEAVLRYSRELAFAAADVYASAAESRGAWDARVEAGVVDALVRGHAGELTLSRAGSLGWSRVSWVVALATPAPQDLDVTALRATARHSGLSLLVGEASVALVLVLGGTSDVDLAVAQVVEALPEAPVVVGPQANELGAAASSVQEALAGLAAVPGWPQAPRPVAAGELLAERAVLGEEAARRRLLEDVYRPLEAAGGDLLATASAYLEGGGSVEGTGRALFLHPNTVRYRLRKLADVVGYDLTDPRVGLVMRVALILGRTVDLSGPHNDRA